MAQKQTILVTGGAGFIGSHLCKRLHDEGHKVISLDNYFTGSAANHIPDVFYIKSHTKGIEKSIEDYFPNLKHVDVIYHLGEYARVEQSLEEPGLVWDLNIAGTFAVLEYWRKHQNKLIYAGSSTKFGDGGLARVATPYAWTKAANTELVKNYGDWYGLHYAVTYFYNVYGPRERAGKYGTVVEIFKQKFLKGEALIVEEPGVQMRNFTHVNDIINGLILVSEKAEGDDFGIGDERAYTIMALARMFGGEVRTVRSRPGNRMNSAIDTTKIRSLGWKPEHSLEDYVREIVAKK